MPHETFIEKQRKIQNQIRIFDPESILISAMDYLYSPAEGALDQASKQPWLVLLLIKWTYLDPLAQSFFIRKKVSPTELKLLLQLIYNLGDSDYVPNGYAGVQFLFRSLAYQQFFHQKNTGLTDIARQKVLFGHVPENHYFKTKFYKITGLNIPTFIRLAAAFLSIVQAAQESELPTRQKYIFSRSSIFETLSFFDPFDVHVFLESISITNTNLTSRLRDKDNGVREIDEYMIPTQFLRFPLVKIEEIYICVSPHVLYRGLGHFIYDLLKEHDINNFNHPFSVRFEQHIHELVKGTGLPFVGEKELIASLDGFGKVVDFLVQDEEANIFIDAKGVEIAQKGMVATSYRDMRSVTKTSLIKAFHQGHEACHRLRSQKARHPIVRHRDKNYLLAITYKELYVGNGKTLSEVVDSTFLDSIRSSYPEESHIPDENIYILTISEFELLTHLISNGRIGLVEALEKAKKNDSNFQTKKFDFGLHLSGIERDAKDYPLKKTVASIIEEIKAMAK